MTERDIVRHATWRAIVASLSRSDYDRLWSMAQLYSAVCGLPPDDLFPNESINEACHDLARPSPLYGHKVPSWNRDECARLMASRTLLPMQTCEAYVDGELINVAIGVGKLHDVEPMQEPKSTLPRTQMTSQQIVDDLHESVRSVAWLEGVSIKVFRLSPPDLDGCNWYAKHSGLPAKCPPKTVRLLLELIQLARDAFELIDDARCPVDARRKRRVARK